MKKPKLKINKPVYLGFSILEISKLTMHEFWYDYMKPKYGEKTKLCYMGTGSFIIRIKTEDFYKYIADDVKKIFDSSNYELNRPLLIGQSKTVIGLYERRIRRKDYDKMCCS